MKFNNNKLILSKILDRNQKMNIVKKKMIYHY